VIDLGVALNIESKKLRKRGGASRSSQSRRIGKAFSRRRSSKVVRRIVNSAVGAA
jgi:hypothetical protein